MNGIPLAAIILENDETLQAIEHPVDHAETGAFAFCESCGKEIDERRLRIVPSATRCGRCAQDR